MSIYDFRGPFVNIAPPPHDPSEHRMPFRFDPASPRRRAALVLALLVALPLRAHATLGGALDSVRDDAARLGGTRTVATAAAWDVHEIRVAASGDVVREYAARDGTVFAIAWSGRRAPDLRQLLGGSFDAYRALARRRRGGHHHVAASDARLAIESSAHNRAFAGRAWMPGALPAGFAFGRAR